MDDVITAGTAIREAVATIAAESRESAIITGIAVSLDRQEITGAPLSTMDRRSAIQNVEADLGIPVVSVVTLRHLIGYVKGGADPELIRRIEAYNQEYGVLY